MDSGNSEDNSPDEGVSLDEVAEMVGADPEQLAEHMPPVVDKPDQCPECGFEPEPPAEFTTAHGVGIEETTTTLYCPNCGAQVAGDGLLNE